MASLACGPLTRAAAVADFIGAVALVAHNAAFESVVWGGFEGLSYTAPSLFHESILEGFCLCFWHNRKVRELILKIVWGGKESWGASAAPS
jgi:hypothetical protein